MRAIGIQLVREAVILLAAILASAAALWNLPLPLVLALGMPLVVAVLIALRASKWWFLAILIATVLMLVGFVASPPPGDSAVLGLIPRILLFAGIWAATAVLVQWQHDLDSRRRSEEKLRDKEARLRLMVEQVPAVLWTTDVDLRFTSSAGAGLTGLDLQPDQVVGMSLFEFFETEDEDFPAIALHRRACQGESVNFEMEWAGHVYRSHAEPLRDGDGSVVGVIGVALDVTDLKHADEELKRLNLTLEEQVEHRTETLQAITVELRRTVRHTRMIVDTAKEAFIGMDAGGFIVDWNPAAEAIFGWSRAEALGRPLAETIIPPQHVEEYREGLRQFLKTGESPFLNKIVEFSALHRDGHEFQVEMSATHIKFGESHYFNAFLHDISERKQAEQDLRDSEALYSSLVEHLPLNILLKDLKGRFTFANRTYCSLSGIPLDKIVGKTDLDLYPAELANKYRADDQKIIATGELFEDIEAHQKGEETIYVQVLKTPVHDAQGNIVGTQAIFWDVTEKRLAEENLKRYSTELERSNRELEQFTTVVSHDLHAPLRAVSTYCELFQREYGEKLDSTADEYLYYAKQSVERMQVLIEDLRSVARVTTRGKPLEPVDCQEALDAALTNLAAEIETSSASVTHDELPTVAADSTQLMQLFQNLVGNAVKYCKGRPPEIHISADRSDGDWLFGVRDNGIGIDPSDQKRIFEIFERLHAEEDEYSGSGVGLAICKRIVERHGGRIWVESEPGEGSTFRFTIPAGAH